VAATRQTGDTILVAQRTRELLTNSDPTLAQREGVTLKGKHDSVCVYAPETNGSVQPPGPQ
jgi:hypothetical protein